MTQRFVCDKCGWDVGPEVHAGAECDSCGGDLVCAECYEPPEFCRCAERRAGAKEET